MDDKPGKVSKNRWHSRWFLLKGGMDARGPKGVGLATLVDKPKALPIDETFASLEKLKMRIPLLTLLADLPPRSSPPAAEPSHSSFSPPDEDLPQEQPSSSLARKRPSDEAALQGKEKRARAAFELSEPPKGGIPPLPFPSYDLLMATGCFTLEFLTPPYTLLGGYSNTPDPLEVYENMCRRLIQVANAGFELGRRADFLGEENKDLKAQAPLEKVASLEEELAKVNGKLAESQRINVRLTTERRKLTEDFLGLR
ncbi:hypothetical protein LIER_25167 [Lithospermum erythrorhizon]|uniref:Uncharacterized protein n=1 Tax=Lithospermum erythrorhizon TaxID=34254 RepID=A0AAV3R811_LITER